MTPAPANTLLAPDPGVTSERLRGAWNVSASSMHKKTGPVLHFVPDADGEAYCTGVRNLRPSDVGRYCLRCLAYLMRDGFIRWYWT